MSAEGTETNRENNVDVIAGLIKSCRAAQAGFLNAAEQARNSDLGAYFTGRSLERARFAAELERAAQQLDGAEHSRSAPMAERVQRAWVDLTFARGTSDGAILNDVAAAERTMRDFYRQAMSLEFPPEVATLLERQAESVSDAYDQICTLRDMRGRAA
jgi:uncharacterized protein (TIGR02284 family)